MESLAGLLALVLFLLGETRLFCLFLELLVHLLDHLLLFDGLKDDLVTLKFKTSRQPDVQDGCLVSVNINADIVVFVFAGFEGGQGEFLDGLLPFDLGCAHLARCQLLVRLLLDWLHLEGHSLSWVESILDFRCELVRVGHLLGLVSLRLHGLSLHSLSVHRCQLRIVLWESLVLGHVRAFLSACILGVGLVGLHQVVGLFWGWFLLVLVMG
jgi:hypothetical protein